MVPRSKDPKDTTTATIPSAGLILAGSAKDPRDILVNLVSVNIS